MENNEYMEENMVEDSDSIKGKYLTFIVGESTYAVPVSEVIQIIPLQKITPVPVFPDYAAGVITLRDTVIPVIEVRKRIGIEYKEHDARSCIIVLKIADRNIGIVIDRIAEICNISDNEITNNTGMIPGNNNVESYLVGIANKNDNVILIMDSLKLVCDSDMDAVFSVTEQKKTEEEND